MIATSPTRTRILKILDRGRGATLADLRREMGLSSTALRQQLIVLERDGLVRRALVRGRPGRPAIVYQPASPSGQGPEASFATLLSAILETMEARAPEQFEQTLGEVAARLAAGHTDIARIPDAEARIRAALAVLFDVAGDAVVTGIGRDFEVVLRTCALLPAAEQFPGVCAITRRLLGALVGANVTQLESIAQGAPRCRFTLALTGDANQS